MAGKNKGAAGGDGDSLAQVEEIANNAAGALKVAQFKAWLYSYFHPYQACEKEKKGASLSGSASTFALTGIVNAVAMIIATLILAAFTMFAGLPMLIGAFAALVIYPILSVVGGFIMSAIYYVVAKVLGGKGGFMEQTYCMALVSGGTVLMMAPFSILQALPVIGGLFGLLVMAVGIYGLISQYRTVRAVHSLSQLRAIVVIVVPLILLALAIATFLAALMVALGVGAVAGGMGSGYGY
ncbi:MAG: Yip1 family protein [Candidatus Micrarchaeia archaeon]